MKIKDILNKYDLRLKKYTLKKDIRIVDTNKGKYLLKPKKRYDKKDVYDYLASRNFEYFLKPINEYDEDGFEVFDYILDINAPREQKANDMMYLISLLHNKTTFYKEVDLDDIKSRYEDIRSELVYLNYYYHDLQDIIEKDIYMSPSSYLLIRNMSKIYNAIEFSMYTLDNWYEIVKSKKRERRCYIHNNLEFDHLLQDDSNYLISWDKSKIDIPIYDFYSFYKHNYRDIDGVTCLKIYESKYPLLEEERLLLLILLALPIKIELTDKEYINTKKVNDFLLYLEKTNNLISNYRSNNKEKEKA